MRDHRARRRRISDNEEVAPRLGERVHVSRTLSAEADAPHQRIRFVQIERRVGVFGAEHNRVHRVRHAVRYFGRRCRANQRHRRLRLRTSRERAKSQGLRRLLS